MTQAELVNALAKVAIEHQLLGKNGIEVQMLFYDAEAEGGVLQEINYVGFNAAHGCIIVAATHPSQYNQTSWDASKDRKLVELLEREQDRRDLREQRLQQREDRLGSRRRRK